MLIEGNPSHLPFIIDAKKAHGNFLFIFLYARTHFER